MQGHQQQHKNLPKVQKSDEEQSYGRALRHISQLIALHHCEELLSGPKYKVRLYINIE